MRAQHALRAISQPVIPAVTGLDERGARCVRSFEQPLPCPASVSWAERRVACPVQPRRRRRGRPPRRGRPGSRRGRPPRRRQVRPLLMPLHARSAANPHNTVSPHRVASGQSRLPRLARSPCSIITEGDSRQAACMHCGIGVQPVWLGWAGRSAVLLRFLRVPLSRLRVPAEYSLAQAIKGLRPPAPRPLPAFPRAPRAFSQQRILLVRPTHCYVCK